MVGQINGVHPNVQRTPNIVDTTESFQKDRDRRFLLDSFNILPGELGLERKIPVAGCLGGWNNPFCDIAFTAADNSGIYR